MKGGVYRMLTLIGRETLPLVNCTVAASTGSWLSLSITIPRMTDWAANPAGQSSVSKQKVCICSMIRFIFLPFL